MKRRVAILAGLLVGAAHVAAQSPTFSSKVETVRLDALVTENGVPIRGLTEADFEVFDNGVPQHIDFVALDTAPLNLSLVLDVSDSVQGRRLDQLRAAAASAIGGLRSGDAVSLVTFSERVTVAARHATEWSDAVAQLKAIESGGGTALIDATYAGLRLAPTGGGRTIAIVFTDGVDTMSWLRADRVVEAARRAEVVVYGVTTSADRRDRVLHDISEVTGGRMLVVRSPASLGDMFRAILQEFRQRYVIGFTARTAPTSGWHELAVRLKSRRGQLVARPGYFVGAR